MFVFGGFYRNSDNYMKFQNNIDQFTFDDKSVTIVNVSKGKNKDSIRPRTFYEIIESEQHEADKLKINVIGGYGKVFSRPYSLMASIYYEIVFNTKNASIESITRKTTEPIKINIPKPIRVRTIADMPIMSDDDSWTTRQRVIHSDGYLFHNTQFTIGKAGVDIEKSF